MAQTFVKIGMYITPDSSPFTSQTNFFVRTGKLVDHPGRFSRHIIGISDIVQSHRFTSVAFADPLGIGQIDPYRSSRMTISAKHSYLHNTSSDSFHFLFLKFLADGGMLFEPECLSGQFTGAFSGFLIDDLHHRFPTGLISQRIPVYLYKSVDKIDRGLILFQPFDRIPVKKF